jgi:Leucine-rich repeat (LRR) protein
MDKVSEADGLEKIRLMFLSGEKEQMELALILAEANELNLSAIESGIKSILAVAKLQPRLGQWADAKMENLIIPLGMVLMLSIEETEIKMLPPEIALFPNLGIIELHGINLEKIPSEIQFLRKLRSFSAKHNRLKVLPEELGNLLFLKSLNLHDNLLEKLPDSLQQLSQLEVLELSKNPNLLSLPAWVSKLPSLKKLVLDKNVFKEKIPEQLLPLPQSLSVEWEQIQPKFK